MPEGLLTKKWTSSVSDYYGRKRILLCTTLLMTLATASIGLLPAERWVLNWMKKTIDI